ncbi:hypothetical protein [Sphingorhabdus sp.]|uniref:hypothetical protein n=1 Tax=Sphingorhabdus sp. TaxID=1902408 RepID=UPI003BAF9F5F|nr:hypothetical protein [Sphingomonadales bacterium]MBK9431110.1 hypothetical protein [Sphingomonadales bacterium]MBL0021247.1 hypothetical protein [Sphingomonadales bacterium]
MTEPASGKDLRSFWLFATASLVTIAAGAGAIFLSGNGAMQPVANLAAWLAGALLATVLAKFGKSPQMLTAIIALTFFGLSVTLFNTGVEGVHRWISLGPVNANLAALLLPPCIVALARFRLSSGAKFALITALLLLLLAQPDASQATGLALASCILARDWNKRWRLLSSAAFIALAASVWLRVDPLEPVATVEGIVGLAVTVSPLLAVLILAALSVTIASIPMLVKHSGERTAGYALFAYAAAVSLSAGIGNFPVPLAGFGISFPIGWWLAAGLLIGKRA